MWLVLETEKEGVDPGLPRHYADLRQVMPLAFAVWNTARRCSDPRVQEWVLTIEGMAAQNKRFVKPYEDQLRRFRISKGKSPWPNFRETFALCSVAPIHIEAGREIMRYAGLIDERVDEDAYPEMEEA
jgi:hypothetical protein